MSNASSSSSIHPSFRINAKSFFITYPQCPKTKEEVKAFLESKAPLSYYLIGQELHQDGNPHIHAVVTYKRKLNVKSSRFFDLDEYHGNVQPARNMQALKVYITKEDPEPLTSDNSSDEETDNLYDLARVTPEETFFEVCRKKKVSIHPKLDPFYVRPSGIPKDTTRCKRKHNSRRIHSLWDDYLRKLTEFAIARGYDFSMGERTIRDRKDHLGVDCIEQTCTIREASGYITRIQKWIPQDDYLRRHVIPSSTQASTDRTSGQISSSADSHPLHSSQPSSWNSQDIFVQ